MNITPDMFPITHERYFHVPILPQCVEGTVVLDPQLAQRVFPRAAELWVRQLPEYEGPHREWIEDVWLPKKGMVTSRYGRPYMEEMHWECMVETDDSGFARFLSISRNAGGSLYCNPRECEFPVLVGSHSRVMQAPIEVARAFSLEQISEDVFQMYVYAPHNVDFFPGALFLRNWAALYMNEVFQTVCKR
ncbi:hypothetical protein GF342_03410 [Candidatus Woesearchaeota archaeon]|nr:hypothetical protein [Candidatus Woesearchaeota archaeon]